MRRGSIAWVLIGICLMVYMRGGVNVEEQAFIVTIGIDREDNGDIGLTLEIPSAQASASGSSGPDNKESTGGYELVYSKAPNIMDAMELLDASIPREISFSQVLLVVVSESLASHPVFYETLLGLLTFHNFRQSAELLVCRGKAREFTQTQQPFLGIRLSSNIRTSLKVYGKKGDIPRASVGQTVRCFQGGWNDVLMPYASITDSGGETEAVQGRALDIMAGQMIFEGNEKVEYLGGAVFRKKRMAGLLTGMEMQFLSFVVGEMDQFVFSVDGVYYIMDPLMTARTSVDTKSEQWKLRVSGVVQACVLQQGTADAERIKEAFTDEVLNILQKLQEMGVDPIGFEGKAVRAHGGSLKDWERVDWVEKYRDAAIEVEIKVHIAKAT